MVETEQKPKNDGFRQIYAWRNLVKGYWPRRLMYIPKMTSYERVGDDTYNNVCKPKYAILSYTWGRWRCSAEPGKPKPPALDVKGIFWDIPAISEDHFSVKTFEKAIRQIGRDVDWVWIDVACIDQTDGSIEKNEEIGRQVGIFHNAVKAYVWLSRLPKDTLDKNLAELWEYGPEIPFYPSTKYSLKTIVEKLHANLLAIFDDPWFTSLWTLQELILRKDAIILSREADTIPLSYQPEIETRMAIIVNSCSNIHKDLKRIKEKEQAQLQRSDPGLLGKIDIILEEINKAGFTVLITDNPNIQYGMARYRQPGSPLDRIYGIMQIYGLQVGEAADPKRSRPEFNELEDEFAAAICEKCPVLGQLFLHLRRPPKGDSWRISQYSRVPKVCESYREVRPECKITLSPKPGTSHASTTKEKPCRKVLFEGKMVPLVDLLQHWARYTVSTYPPDADYRSREFAISLLEFFLDSYAEEDKKQSNLWSPASERAREITSRMDFGSENNDVRKLKGLLEGLGGCYGDVFGLNVMLLGQRKVVVRLSLEENKRFENLGLLVRAVEGGTEYGVEGEVYYERLGFCVWNSLAAFPNKDFDETLPWKEGVFNMM